MVLYSHNEDCENVCQNEACTSKETKNIGNGPHSVICEMTGDDKLFTGHRLIHYFGQANCFYVDSETNNKEGLDLWRHELIFDE